MLWLNVISIYIHAFVVWCALCVQALGMEFWRVMLGRRVHPKMDQPG